MPKGTIILCYRKVIDANSIKAWEKMVLEDTFLEFKMQAQFYNQEKKYNTFSEILRNDPKAEKLHFLVSAAVTGYLQQLNETIPDVLNNLGKHFLKFENFRFEIINSDIRDITKHQVAINFFSKPLTWHDTIDNYLLVSDKSQTEKDILTSLFQLQPYLSIYSLSYE